MMYDDMMRYIFCYDEIYIVLYYLLLYCHYTAIVLLYCYLCYEMNKTKKKFCAQPMPTARPSAQTRYCAIW